MAENEVLEPQVPGDEDILGDVAPEEVPTEEVPPEEEVAEAGTSPMIHTVDEVPELAGKAVGDTITFRVDNVTEDGNTFELSVMAGEEELGAAPGEELGAGPGAAQQEIRDVLLQ